MMPLSDTSLALLESKPEDTNRVRRYESPALSDMSLTAVIWRMNGDEKPVWADANGKRTTFHGFRSTFLIWTAETTNNPKSARTGRPTGSEQKVDRK